MSITTSNPQGTSSNSAGTSITLSYTATASTTMLIVMLSTRGASASTSPAITYNGVSMTLIGSSAHSTAKISQHYFYLASPATGSAYNISASWSGISKPIMQAVCLLGSDVIAPTGYNGTTGSAATGSIDITTVSGDLVISAFSQNTTGGDTLTAGQTLVNTGISTSSGSTDHISATEKTTATTTTTSMTWSSTNSGNFVIAGFAVAVAPSTASTGNWFLMFN